MHTQNLHLHHILLRWRTTSYPQGPESYESCLCFLYHHQCSKTKKRSLPETYKIEIQSHSVLIIYSATFFLHYKYYSLKLWEYCKQCTGKDALMSNHDMLHPATHRKHQWGCWSLCQALNQRFKNQQHSKWLLHQVKKRKEEVFLTFVSSIEFTCISQYTFGFGHPSGGWQVSLKGSPSWAVTVMGGPSLKEFSSALRTNTEFEVAVPHSFVAKHWYWPTK